MNNRDDEPGHYEETGSDDERDDGEGGGEAPDQRLANALPVLKKYFLDRLEKVLRNNWG